MLWQAFPVKPWSAGRKKEGTSKLGYSALTRRANEATLSLQQKTLGFLVIQGSRLGFLRPTLARMPTVRFPIPEASAFFLFAGYNVYNINLYIRCESGLCQHRTGIYTCTVSSFTGPLWRVLHKQTSLAMTQAYPTLTTGESVLHVCVWCFWENAFDAGRDTSRSQSWWGEWRHASIWTYYAARTGHDMACTLLCHATRDTPLKDKFTQHLPSKCCPSLTSPLSPSWFWLLSYFSIVAYKAE